MTSAPTGLESSGIVVIGATNTARSSQGGQRHPELRDMRGCADRIAVARFVTS
jgi:hypothetical protein